MGKIKNKDFFRQPVSPSASDAAAQKKGTSDEKVVSEENAAEDVRDDETENNPVDDDVVRVVQLPEKLIDNVKDTSQTLLKIGLRPLANEVVYLYKKVLDSRFSIAVVGEFSKGKSSLINRILGRDILPKGDLPTTAILTRIAYGKNETMTVLDSHGRKVRQLPLGQESWKGLTADNFGTKEPEGSVLIQIPDKFLGKYHVNIIDTPGAGDLEAKRARVIEQCLMGADAAIIAIDATKPFSMTEIQFIKQKLLSRKIPFMAVALTKLDMVNEKEREQVADYAFKKLEALKIKIPVLILDDNVKIPGGKYDNIIGIDKFPAMALAWITHESRRELTENWLVANVNGVLDVASGLLEQQKAILDAKGDEKEKIIAQRNQALSNVKGQWESLRDELKKRCQDTIDAFNAKAKEYGDTIIEALQHEVGRVPSAKEWLDKEYAYRVKRELSAVSLSLDKLVEGRMNADLHWLNESLAKQFKEIVRVEPEKLNAKDDFTPNVDPNSIQLESIKKKSVEATVTGAALTLGAALAMGAFGGGVPVIFATLGVGTGINVISRKMLANKGDEQKEQVQKLIAQEIPNVIQEASADSAVKIRIMYNNIISSSLATETRWMQTQRTLIRQSVKNADDDKAAEKLAGQIAEVNRLKKLF